MIMNHFLQILQIDSLMNHNVLYSSSMIPGMTAAVRSCPSGLNSGTNLVFDERFSVEDFELF